jgi:tetratricopeptide (TPR) repeat protein
VGAGRKGVKHAALVVPSIHMARCAQPQPKTRVAMPESLLTLAQSLWSALNAGPEVVAALLAVGSVTGSGPASLAVGGDANNSALTTTIIHNHGPTPEQIAAIFAEVRDLSPASEAQAAAALYGTLSRAALSSFFAILREQEVPPEQLPAKLAEIALRHREALERLDALQLDSPDDPQRLSDARAAIEQGDFARADQLLAAIEEEQAAAHAKAQANADALARRQAATRAERARLSELRQDYLAAADHFLAAANLLPAGDTEERGNLLTDSADALRQHGEELGDNSALHRAIARYNNSTPLRTLHPILWGRIQNNLGNALRILGERERNCLYIQQSIDALTSALLERNQILNPLDWSITQSNIGISLSILGEYKDDKKLLQRAVEVFSSALSALNLVENPIEWARTQANLGNTFAIIGEKEENIEFLRKSLSAFSESMVVFQAEKLPFEFATIQNSAGNVLLFIGNINKNPKIIQQAINLHREALLIRTSARAPHAWAITQTNLGADFQSLASLTHDVNSAQDAVTAQEAALEMFTRLNNPSYITLATDNLALARATLAELEGGADDSPPHQ